MPLELNPENLISTTVQNYDSYFPSKYSDGLARYAETQDLIENAYKEQQHWTEMYERAQRLGITGYTVQEITLKLQAISQRLQTLNNIFVPASDQKLQFDGGDLRLESLAEDIGG